MSDTANLALRITATDQASPELASLNSHVASIAATAKQAEGGVGGSLAKIGSDVEGAGQKADVAKGAFGGLGAALQNIGQIASGIVLGGIVSQLTADLGTRITDTVTKTSELATATLELQRQIGGSADSASQLLAVFERYGVGLDQASTSLGIFSKHLAGIEDIQSGLLPGSKSFKQSMDEIGVSFLSASGAALPMDQVLSNVADKFASMPDGVDKTALSMQLFGRAGKDMIPVLNLGSAGMQEAQDAAQRYGLSLSGANVEAVLQFGLAHKDLDEAVTGVTVTLGNTIMPALTNLARTAASAAQEFNQDLLPAIKGVNLQAVGAVAAFAGTGIAIQGIVAAGTALAPVLATIATSDIAVAASLTITAASAAEAATGVGLLGAAVATALGPIGLITLAVGGLTVAYETNFVGVRNAAQGWEDLNSLAASSAVGTGQASQGWEDLGNMVQSQVPPFQHLGDTMAAVAESGKKLGSTVTSVTPPVAHLGDTMLAVATDADQMNQAFIANISHLADLAIAADKVSIAYSGIQTQARNFTGEGPSSTLAKNTANTKDLQAALANASQAYRGFGVAVQAAIPGLAAFDAMIFGTSQKVAGLQLQIEEKILGRMESRPARTVGQQLAVAQEQLKVENLQRQVEFGGALRATSTGLAGTETRGSIGALGAGVGGTGVANTSQAGGASVTFDLRGLTVNDAAAIGAAVTAKLQSLISSGKSAPGQANLQLAGARGPGG